MKTALTIAGSDSSGGAGIQADIKTMTAHGIYAMSAITALTAQNTLGVTEIYPVSVGFLAKELDAIFTDIYPDAVKIGMLSSQELMEVVKDKMEEYKVKHLVLDPVMVATSGSDLMENNAYKYMLDKLFPLAEIVTPNIPEAEKLAGIKIKNAEDMIHAGQIIFDTSGAAVLVKGGHSINDANDILVYEGGFHSFEGKRIDNPNTHGTGCTLSSAIASNLAKGDNLITAVEKAKEYITGALEAGLNLGHGSGPLNHMWRIEG